MLFGALALLFTILSLGLGGMLLVPWIDRAAARRLVGSNLLRSWNVAFLLVGPEDRETLDLLAAAGVPPARPSRVRSLVFPHPGALPPEYFATHAYPFEDAAFERGMLDDEAPVRSAFVPGWEGPGELPPARVVRVERSPSRLEVEVDAPAGGLLVVSASHHPDWRARVDGRPVPVERVNGRVQGVRVPPGGRTVSFRYASPFLGAGLALAAAGCALLLFGAVRAARRRRAQA